MVQMGRSCRASWDRVDDLCQEVRTFIAAQQLSSHDIFAVELLLRETMTNAVAHGAKGDARRRVRCRVSIFPQQILELEVQDPGEGFDWRSAAKNNQAPTGSSGRGLLILRHYADTILYNEKGNTVILRRKFKQGT